MAQPKKIPNAINQQVQDIDLQMDGYTGLHWAAGHGEVDQVNQFLNNGVDINVPDEFGSTPLHWAALCGCQKIVALLINRGANTDALDEHGHTPSDLARKQGHFEVINILDGRSL